MTNYVTKALFLFSEESAELQEQINHRHPTISIESAPIESFIEDIEKNKDSQKTFINTPNHIIISAPANYIKKIIEFVLNQEISIAIIPLASQKKLEKTFYLPGKIDDQIDQALQSNAKHIDIIRCNNTIVLYQATMGRLPLLDASEQLGIWGRIKQGVQKLHSMRLLGFNISTNQGKTIKTAACGCMILQPHGGSLVNKLLGPSLRSNNGMLSLIVSAPKSLLEYIFFILQPIQTKIFIHNFPATLAHIQSSDIEIKTEHPIAVMIDGINQAVTPIKFSIQPLALKINTGKPSSKDEVSQKSSHKEKIEIKNLPLGSELDKLKKYPLPLFSYASEERFKDLFLSLREDARINSAFIILMVLSTLLATVGLFQNSASVVIGAMVLAPLMAPIISVSMGILRGDSSLYKQSSIKIIVGIGIALFSSVIVTRLLPDTILSNEMLARLSPSLLDLAVAIFAGIAAG